MMKVAFPASDNFLLRICIIGSLRRKKLKRPALAFMMIFVCSLFLSFEKVFASTLNLPYTLPATINGIEYSDVLGVPAGNDWKVIYYTSDGNPYAYADAGEVIKDSQNNRNPPNHYAYFLCVAGSDLLRLCPPSTSTSPGRAFDEREPGFGSGPGKSGLRLTPPFF